MSRHFGYLASLSVVLLFLANCATTNSNIEKMLASGDAAEAERLYAAKHAGQKATDDKASTPLVEAIQNRLNADLEPDLERMSVALSQHEHPVKHDSYPEVSKIVGDAKTALETYSGHYVFNEESEWSAKARELKQKVKEVEKVYQDATVDAFTAFDHFSGTDFFAVYPVKVDDRTVIQAGFDRIHEERRRAVACSRDTAPSASIAG